MTRTCLRQLARSEAGFTIVEMMIATMIMMAVTGAVFQLMSPSYGTFQTQPEVSDMQQRLRVGVDSLAKDLIMAGAGTYHGAAAGALNNFFAPIMPYRFDDPAKGIYYRPDAISLIYVPPTPSQTSISAGMPANSAEIKVNPQPNCPGNKQNQLCGFDIGMRLIIFDSSGNYDLFTVTEVQDAAAHLQHRQQGAFTVPYEAGAAVTQMRSVTYYLKNDDVEKSYQLMYFDGWQTDLPVVDDVVKLEFEYFGEPQPPELLPNVSLAAGSTGPWTTYGPRPPALGVDNASDLWPAGENCAFAVVAGAHVPRLPRLADGVGQVKLDPATFIDGPWCIDENKPNRYDADLLRIRRVRVKMRVQASKPFLRGPAGVLFAKAGTSDGGQRYVPDHEVQFDITPRNLNLGR